MAELVDAPDSKSGSRKRVGVRFPLRALENQLLMKDLLCGSFSFAQNLHKIE